MSKCTGFLVVFVVTLHTYRAHHRLFSLVEDKFTSPLNLFLNEIRKIIIKSQTFTTNFCFTIFFFRLFHWHTGFFLNFTRSCHSMVSGFRGRKWKNQRNSIETTNIENSRTDEKQLDRHFVHSNFPDSTDLVCW